MKSHSICTHTDTCVCVWTLFPFFVVKAAASAAFIMWRTLLWGRGFPVKAGRTWTWSGSRDQNFGTVGIMLFFSVLSCISSKWPVDGTISSWMECFPPLFFSNNLLEYPWHPLHKLTWKKKDQPEDSEEVLEDQPYQHHLLSLKPASSHTSNTTFQDPPQTGSGIFFFSASSKHFFATEE